MKRCPRCAKAGDDPTIGCPDKSILGCPAAVDVIPGKDVILVCRNELCGKMFSLPATSIVHRTIPTEIQCQKTPCEMVAIAAPIGEAVIHNEIHEALSNGEAPKQTPYRGKPGKRQKPLPG